jgi:soluble cytochrome b562
MLLLKLPEKPTCNYHFFWLKPAAGEQLYCAGQLANRKTANGLLEAIAIAHDLPQDHPLHQQIDRNIEEWAEQLLDLAEESFHTGKIAEAIATARQIPGDTSASQIVDDRIRRWETIWQEAENHYQKAEAALEKENWTEAFWAAQKLQFVENRYWQTTQFDALFGIIEGTKEAAKTLDKARDLAESNEIKNLLEAVRIVEEFDNKHKLYKAARALKMKFAEQMMRMAQENLDRQNWQDAIYIARQVPTDSPQKNEAVDFVDLARAQSLAARGSVISLEDAISKAQQIGAGRPLYGEAQRLIMVWQKDIQDLAYLEKARQRAKLGSPQDLRMAISQAQLVGNTNSRWSEAQDDINRWQNLIEVQEDRPYLMQAQDLANYGDRLSLEAAIDTARQIRPGRELHNEAQNKIDAWRGEIERLEDQPILDQAWKLAKLGNLDVAIAQAEKIRPGRILYQEAQSAIFAWKTEIKDRDNFEQANRLGSGSTNPANLIRAIETMNQISMISPLRSKADNAINEWSGQLFIMAKDESQYDLLRAIDIAKSIPFYAANYQVVQGQIEEWKRIIAPPPKPAVQDVNTQATQDYNNQPLEPFTEVDIPEIDDRLYSN